MRLKKLWPLLPYIVILLLLCLSIFFLGSRVSQEQIQELVQRAGIFGPIIYILLFASTHIIAPLSGTPIFFAGYAVFGEWIQVYTYLATLLSATISFWISRIWGRKLVQRFVGKDELVKMDEFTEKYGIKSLIFLRAFSGHLVDFISYAYGLTNIKFLPYILITAIAPLPWLLFWQFFIFPRVKNIGDFTIWWIVTLIPLIVVSWLFFKFQSGKNNS